MLRVGPGNLAQPAFEVTRTLHAVAIFHDLGPVYFTRLRQSQRLRAQSSYLQQDDEVISSASIRRPLGLSDQEGIPMKFAHTSARVAFVVHLEVPTTLATDVARIEHVVHLFRGLNVPATWIVAAGKNYEHLLQQGMISESDQLALAIAANETGAANFRDALRKRLTTTLEGQTVSLIAGEPSTFRAHAAFLSEQGIRGVISNAVKRRGAPAHSPLPCGLWQIDHALTIPGQSLFANLLPGSSASRRLHKLIIDEQTISISVDASRIAHTSMRSIQHLESMLHQVAHLASRDEIRLTTAGQIIAELAASRASRPQHSILRAA